ncbi:MAG: aminotransferase class V-fold PLP-dependent enzyme [SAR202 cluster bacterium]|nr:aminotransferase class V-fold PLP-dependent enzyme [SAR202 cluster bacterium]
MLDVQSIRSQIPASERTVYLNSGWSGPSPDIVNDAIIQRLQLENQEGPTSPDVMANKVIIKQELLRVVASLFNVTEQELFLTQNTTEGINIVLNGLSWEQGDEVVVCDIEHPSVLIPSYYLQSRGAVVRMAHVEPQFSQDQILEEISSALTKKTRLVFVSHIQYTSGLKMPIKALAGLLRERGILLLVDGAQGSGHLEVDFRGLGVDFYATTGHKWLLGPEGVGFLFIREGLINQVRPMYVSSHAVADYDLQGNYSPNRSQMDKFGLTTSSTALYAGSLEAVRFMRGIGLDNVEKHNLSLARMVRGALTEIPNVHVFSPSQVDRSSALVSFKVSGVDSTRLVEKMWHEERIVARSISEFSAVRLSLHCFNTQEDLDTVVAYISKSARH